MRRERVADKIQELLPLKPADFHILLALAERELHGYGLMKAVEQQSGGSVRLELGSLYRQIARLVGSGLIEGTAEEEPDRRRLYRITGLGRKVLRAEARRLAALVDRLRARKLLDAPEGA
jgi:DNA-binding PadR family transcriptional regulator